MRRMLLCLRILRGYAGRNGGLLVLLASCVLTVFPCFSQTTATLTVRLSDPNGLSLTEAELTLENRSTGFSRELRGQGDGEFQLVGIPPQTYRLLVRADGFAPVEKEVPLRGNVPVTLSITLEIAHVADQVLVSATETADLIDTQSTGTRTGLSSTAMEEIPVAPGSRGLETYLASFPGFAINANGAIHPRGAHNQMTFVVDGLPISHQLTGAFSTALDPNLVDSLELYTGDIPAEFGAKVSGVASISTRSGVGSGRKLFGNTEVAAASFDTVQNLTQVGGEKGRLGYFATIFAVKTNRFLDQVSLDNLHNGGNTQRSFLRVDYQATEKDFLRFSAMAGRSSFALANLRSQHAAGMDQRQDLRDVSIWLRWNRLLSPASTWESVVGYRPTVAQLYSSPGDTPVTASQARHLSTVTFTNRYNRIAGAHNLRMGADIQHFPMSENFVMGITSGSFNVPGTPGFNDGLLPYDLTRGGRLFQFSDRGAGSLYSLFAQDSVKWRRFTFSAGLRYDNYRFLVKGNQMQPRLGIAYHLEETGTVFRASYNRNFQTPPNENLLLSSSAEASRLAPESVRRAFEGADTRLRSQRENVFEVGLQQALFGKASLNASFYHKNSLDQQDNNNFFDTGIIFPVTLARIRVNGAEGRLNLPRIGGFSATLSATHSRAVSTPPFSGGLFLGQDAVDLLSAGPFLIDHDQVLSLQTNAYYAAGSHWWISSTVRYDSGLVANPSDPEIVAVDPDFRDLLPYVDLLGNPARVKPRTITDLAIGYKAANEHRRTWDAQVQFSNLFDRTGLYNFQSVFVGTRLVPPRSVGVKLRFYW